MFHRPYNVSAVFLILALCIFVVPAARSLGDTIPVVGMSASTTDPSLPMGVDATTTAPVFIVSTDTDVSTSTAASSTPALDAGASSVTEAPSSTPTGDATSTPVAATSTPAATALPSDSADTPLPPQQTAPLAPAALPQPKGALPQSTEFMLNAQGVGVLVRFSPNLTVTTPDWSGAFKKPSQGATTTVQGGAVTSAMFFGPTATVALSGNVRLEFDGAAASSTPVAVAPDGTIAPITAACWSGPGQAPRDLFLTYTGGDCATVWGTNLIVITNHTGTFALVEKSG